MPDEAGRSWTLHRHGLLHIGGETLQDCDYLNHYDIHWNRRIVPAIGPIRPEARQIRRPAVQLLAPTSASTNSIQLRSVSRTGMHIVDMAAPVRTTS